MNFRESFTEVRRRMGIINPNDKGDIEWLIRRIIERNKKVFDALAAL